jgi:hypothetical protein
MREFNKVNIFLLDGKKLLDKDLAVQPSNNDTAIFYEEPDKTITMIPYQVIQHAVFFK